MRLLLDEADENDSAENDIEWSPEVDEADASRVFGITGQPAPTATLPGEDAVLGRGDGGLHLHGLHDGERIALLHLRAVLGRPADQAPRHLGDHRSLLLLGAGVCGAAAATQKTQLVADVDKFPGHIACDGDSKSEIVVPILASAGGSGVKKVVAIIDVDCTIENGFDDLDRKYLEDLADLLGRSCDW